MPAPTAPTANVAPRIVAFDAAGLAEAVAIIHAGGVVAVPTETVYGLAADASRPLAVAALFATKRRPAFNPLIVHVLDTRVAERIAVFDAAARALAAAFWPGPLTLVLPARPDNGIAALATAGLGTIAIRVPAHRAIRGLLEAAKVPLAAPSANASGAISPTRAGHVVASLGELIPLVIDDGRTTAGLESTIVGLGVGGPAILRPGPITADAIAAVIGPLAAAGDAIVAPGQLGSHYAPAKPLRLNADSAAAGEWLIGFGAVGGDDTLSAAGDLVEAAANLFEALHRADASDRRGIAVASVPGDGIGAAINDRLRRAAHRHA